MTVTDQSYLTILTQPHLPAIEHISLPIEEHSEPYLLVPSDLIMSLREASNVRFVCMPYSTASIFNDFLPGFPDAPEPINPSRWEAEGHRGMIIYEFRPLEQRVELWHIRVLVKVPGADVRRWIDYTRYRGKAVPKEVMERVYSLGRVNLHDDYDDGGRLGHLDDWYEPCPWQLLEAWYEDAHASEDESDDLSEGGWDSEALEDFYSDDDEENGADDI